MKLLSTAIALLATVALLSIGGASMTGCNNPIDAKDTVGAGDLLPPTAVSVVVLSTTSAKVRFTGTNNESDFRGYVLMTTLGSVTDSVIDSIPMTAAYSGDSAFTVVIDQDVAKTWRVASKNRGGSVSTKVTASFVPRSSTTGLTVNKYAASATLDGLNVDGTVNVVADVPDGITSSGYLSSGSTVDMILENKSAGGSTLTPVNNATLIYLPSTSTLLTQAQITAAVASVSSTTTVAAVSGVAGAFAFYNGKSLRTSGVGTDTPSRATVGMCVLVVSSAGDFARLVVTTVTGANDDSATLTAYTPGANGTGSVLLYKK